MMARDRDQVSRPTMKPSRNITVVAIEEEAKDRPEVVQFREDGK